MIRVCNWLSLPLSFLWSCVLYLLIETISRHSIFEAVDYMTGSTLVFLYNAFILFVSMTLAYLTRRRVFVRTFVSAFWLVLGIINGVVLANRVTPFTGPDLKMVTELVGILNKYMPTWLVVVVLILIALLVIFLIILAVKAPKYQGRMFYRLNIPLVAAAGISLFVVTNLALNARVLSNYFGNIAFAYEDYGLPYCLAVTVFDTGIDCPNGYDEELIEEIVRSSQTDEEDTIDVEDVNIIFLQLESFFDPTTVEFLEFSEDPIPVFRSLMQEYSSGYLTVPSVGAGTANTEFEVITGMSMHYFGAGEYPYKSILKEKACESAAYVLKGLGYATHAIHNNEANFYGRRKIFANLGFQTFTSEEYMADISDTTYTGWVKDYILTDEIMNCLESTDGPDYVYTISVQGHGDYPTESVLDDPEITVTGAENREKNNASWEYYVNQLKEMDDFIGELVETLENYDEPTVLVMFGDHLPTMGLEAEDLTNRYLYQTQYVIYDNFGLEKENVNLTSYQLAAEVMDRLDIHEGTIFTYHQARRKTTDYQIDLEALQYDILYGEQYVYQGQEPYSRTDLQLGVLEITVDSVEVQSDGAIYVHGSNFTASSKVEIDGELIDDTYFLSTELLMVWDAEIEDGAQVDVAQQSNSSTHKVLSRTSKIVYEEESESEAEDTETESGESETESEDTETGTGEDGE